MKKHIIFSLAGFFIAFNLFAQSLGEFKPKDKVHGKLVSKEIYIANFSINYHILSCDTLFHIYLNWFQCMFAYYIQEIQTAVEFIVGGSVWNSEIRFLTEVPSRLRFQDIVIAVGISLGISHVSHMHRPRATRHGGLHQPRPPATFAAAGLRWRLASGVSLHPLGRGNRGAQSR